MNIRKGFINGILSEVRPVFLICFTLSSIGAAGFAVAGSRANIAGAATHQFNLPIEVIPSPVNFGRVVVGYRDTQTMRLSNVAKSSVEVTQIQVSGHGYKVAGISLPVKLGAGKSVGFTISFQPDWAGDVTGSLVIRWRDGRESMKVGLDGVGIAAAAKLTASPTSLSFGNVGEGQSETLDVKLTNAGNVDVAIGTVSVAGAGFAASGGARVTLAPGQSTSVTVSFDPKSAGAVQGSVSIASNAPPLKIALSADGNGRTPTGKQHTVELRWTENSSTVEGYNVYRGTESNGPYWRINGSLDSDTSYADKTVTSGKIYFYVVTAVGKDNVESHFSHPISVTIPTP